MKNIVRQLLEDASGTALPLQCPLRRFSDSKSAPYSWQIGTNLLIVTVNACPHQAKSAASQNTAKEARRAAFCFSRPALT